MPERYQLIIGNKNYSSWSMRSWVMMTHSNIAFDETVVPLYREDTAARLAAFAPAPARVPILRVGEDIIWDSLAILEYLHEQHPDAGLLPADTAARARARSLCAEMHSSFVALRTEAPMNIRSRRPRPLSDAARADIERIESLLGGRLALTGGPFLFGDFGMADACFVPVLMRFRTLGHAPAGALGAYMNRIVDNEAVAAWCKAAEVEPWVIEASA
jgi:glutathione S-transferase